MSSWLVDVLQELDDAWRRLDISVSLEDQARDVARDLKQEVYHLQRIVEDDALRNSDLDNSWV